MVSNSVNRLLGNLKQTHFNPYSFLKTLLQDYYTKKKPLNIKYVTLQDTIFLLKHLGCDLPSNDILIYIKLAFRLKSILKTLPQRVPVGDRSFNFWYDLFLVELKLLLKDSFSEIVEQTSENEDCSLTNFILQDKNKILYKYLIALEKDIITFVKKQKIQNSNSLLPSTSEKSSLPNADNLAAYIHHFATNELESEDEDDIQDQETRPKNMDVEVIEIVDSNEDSNSSTKSANSMSITKEPIASSSGNTRHLKPTKTEILPMEDNSGDTRLSMDETSEDSKLIIDETMVGVNNVYHPIEEVEVPAYKQELDDVEPEVPSLLVIKEVVPVPAEPSKNKAKRSKQSRKFFKELQLRKQEAKISSEDDAADDDDDDEWTPPKVDQLSRKSKVNIKCPLFDRYFQQYFENIEKDRGSKPEPLKLPTDGELTEAIKNSFGVDLKVKLDIYSEVVLKVVRHYLTNIKNFVDFDNLSNKEKLQSFNEKLNIFKLLVKSTIDLTIKAVTKQLEKIGKLLSENDIDLNDERWNDMEIVLTVPFDWSFKFADFVSYGNVINIRQLSTPCVYMLTAKQLYNFPDVTIRLQFSNILFGRTNSFTYESFMTLNSRQRDYSANTRIISECLKSQDKDKRVYGLSTKYLSSYFREVVTMLQEYKVSGLDVIRDLCAEFLADIEYVSVNRKAIVMNSETCFVMNTYDYMVQGETNTNDVCIRHYIHPEVSMFLLEAEPENHCALTLTCNKCKSSYNAFDNEAIFKSFAKHIINEHGYFYNDHQCVNCGAKYSYQELLNIRWKHECTNLRGPS